jgi:hypothetical protein
MYKRFSVEVIHSQKRAQRLALSRRSKIAVIVYVKKLLDSLRIVHIFIHIKIYTTFLFLFH